MGEAKRRKKLDPNYGKTGTQKKIKPKIEAILTERNLGELKLLYIMAIKADSMESPGIVLKRHLVDGQCIWAIKEDELDNCELSKDIIENIKLELSLSDFSKERMFVFEEDSQVHVSLLQVGFSNKIKQALIGMGAFKNLLERTTILENDLITIHSTIIDKMDKS